MKHFLYWCRRHNVLVSILGIILSIIVVPLLIYIAMVTPSRLPVSGSNDWIGFWAAYLGALIGAVVTLVGINYSIKSSRKLMLEDKRIDKSPFFQVEKFLPQSTIKLQNGQTDYVYTVPELQYQLTRYPNKSYKVGVHIKNISNNYALQLKISPIEKKSSYSAAMLFSEKEILSPNEDLYFIICINYSVSELLEKYAHKSPIFTDSFYLRICYNAGSDIITRSKEPIYDLDFWDRKNKLDILIMLDYEYIQDLFSIKITDCRIVPLSIDMLD